MVNIDTHHTEGISVWDKSKIGQLCHCTTGKVLVNIDDSHPTTGKVLVNIPRLLDVSTPLERFW
jgi:hypothetical protein